MSVNSWDCASKRSEFGSMCDGVLYSRHCYATFVFGVISVLYSVPGIPDTSAGYGIERRPLLLMLMIREIH